MIDYKNTQSAEDSLREKHRGEQFLTWVLTTYPKADRDGLRTKFEQMPASFLRDLYPHIWEHGPRGNIYLQHLLEIERRLDAIAAGENGTAWLVDFDAAMKRWAPYLTRQARGTMQLLGVRWGFPNVMTLNRRDTDGTNPVGRLLEHPLWAQERLPDNIRFDAALRTFRTVTLYLPILKVTGLEETKQLVAAYAKDCASLGMLS